MRFFWMKPAKPRASELNDLMDRVASIRKGRDAQPGSAYLQQFLEDDNWLPSQQRPEPDFLVPPAPAPAQLKPAAPEPMTDEALATPPMAALEQQEEALAPDDDATLTAALNGYLARLEQQEPPTPDAGPANP